MAFEVVLMAPNATVRDAMLTEVAGGTAFGVTLAGLTAERLEGIPNGLILSVDDGAKSSLINARHGGVTGWRQFGVGTGIKRQSESISDIVNRGDLQPLGTNTLPDLVVPTPTARQDLALNVTTANVTVAGFSGGSGNLTYAAVLSKPAGSSASFTGTNLGPFALSGLENGKAYVMLVTATDTTSNQTCVSDAVVSVAGNTAANSPLVAGAAPARQDKVTGTTSTAITFAAFSGGSGSVAYSSALSKPASSSASLSGTGLGAYTINGMVDGEGYSVKLTATDSGDNQVAAVSCVVTVAAAASAGGGDQFVIAEFNPSEQFPVNFQSDEFSIVNYVEV